MNQGFINNVVSQGFINTGGSHLSLFNPNQEYMFVSELDHDLALDVSQGKNNFG
jgi:hypothetical protein